MKINSKDLFEYVNNLERFETRKFKVYRAGVYVTDVFWDSEDFQWEPGKFTSGAFFDEVYTFEPIEKNKEIDKINLNYSINDDIEDDIGEDAYETLCKIMKYLRTHEYKINELIDKVNKLEGTKNDL